MINGESGSLLKSARIKVLSSGFILGLVFILLSVYLAFQHMEETKQQRLGSLKQTVEIARNAIEPILVQYRSQNLSREEALVKIRNLVRRMVYEDHDGKNYVFMSAYDGTMLVQPFEPHKEMSDMWDLKDSRGVYIIRELVKAAQSETGQGFVSYHYQRPGRPSPEEKISFVIGIPELECYIGTGQYMADLRESQFLYIAKTAGSVLVLLFLLFLQIRAVMKEIQRQNQMLLQENKSLKLAEKALQSSEAKYRELVEQSPIGLALTRMDGQYVSINSAYSKITGYSQDEIARLTFWDITPPDYLQEDREQVALVESTGKYGPYEKEYIHKDGHPVPVRINGMTVVRDGEKFIWSSVEDITALKNAEKEKEILTERLQQSYKMEAIGTLAGGIAHDFNNILSPILGYTEMMLAEIKESNPRLKHKLTKIHTSSVRARDLVNQILTFSRQEKSEYRLLKIQTVIREALRLIRSTLPRTIDIEKDIQDDCSPVKADPTQIHQIIMNLSTNAYHAMEKDGGVIKISLREIEIHKKTLRDSELEPGLYALLTISDQGMGMDQDLIQKIFDPFFTTKELGKGTGMGLSVVHGIVKNLKGEIRVKSSPGRGTEFSIYLPVDKTEVPEQNQRVRKSVPGRGESILLVDDEEYVIEMEEQVLESMGYQVTALLSSVEALEVFRADPEKFDLVITDMAMPRLPGDKFAAELLKIHPNIPILLYTGYSETISEEKAARMGIRGFMYKPVSMQDLSLKIQQILDEDQGGPAASLT